MTLNALMQGTLKKSKFGLEITNSGKENLKINLFGMAKYKGLEELWK